jgi:hypothetical protein
MASESSKINSRYSQKSFKKEEIIMGYRAKTPIKAAVRRVLRRKK